MPSSRAIQRTILQLLNQRALGSVCPSEVGRGEQGVLTAEPYKSELLPLWRFSTPVIARRAAKMRDLRLSLRTATRVCGEGEAAEEGTAQGPSREEEAAGEARGAAAPDALTVADRNELAPATGPDPEHHVLRRGHGSCSCPRGCAHDV